VGGKKKEEKRQKGIPKGVLLGRPAGQTLDGAAQDFKASDGKGGARK